MATEFKIVFEGEVTPHVAAHVNAAVQSAALGVVAQYFPNPDDPDPKPGNPIGPVSHGEFRLPPRLWGIWFDPELGIRSLGEVGGAQAE